MQSAIRGGAAPPRHFPTRLFAGAVVIVCAALALSAIHSYRSMIELRDLYLEDRAREVSGTLTEQLRGPERLDPSAWSRVMNEATASGDYPWLRYLALLSEKGQPVVSAGQPSNSLYLHETAVRAPRWGRQGGRWGGFGPREQPQAGQPTLFTLRVGVDRASADFISRRAYIHLAISGLAILTLSVLAYLFARTFRHYLELQAQEESQRRLAALGRLAATLAHEIRNPLGAIKGLTQVAQERLPRDHDTQELMTTVVTEAERLERLVNDLLAFARPRSAAAVTLDIRPLLAEVAQQLRCQTDALRIVLKLPVSAAATLVLADPDGLRQVFLNVFLNAVEASPPDSTIEVLIKPSDQTHVIEICDQGTGIGNQDPEELFQPFVTTKTRGTGLGLAVSRQIVERLAGTIELHNRQPTGTVCRIVLPAQSVSTAPAHGIVTSAGG